MTIRAEQAAMLEDVDMTFDGPGIAGALDALDEAGLDALGFGVIGIDADGRVDRYNAWESRGAGLSRGQVLGRHFFSDVAPCMNNHMVADRLEEAGLDAILPYVLTFRMRPTPVRLRLIRTLGVTRRWVLVDRV